MLKINSTKSTFLTLPSTQTINSWNSVGGGTLSGIIKAIATDASNNIYVCGSFTSIGGVSAYRIAKWDGTNWSSIGNNAYIIFNQQPFATVVNSIAVDNSNNVYIGGVFDTIGSSFINYLAKWDGVSWSSLGGGVNNYVYSLKYDPNINTLYIGGSFSNLSNLAKWDGSSLTTLGGGVSGSVFSIQIDRLNNVLVGGVFNQVGGSTSANKIAKWNGISWSSFGSGSNNGVNKGIFYSAVNSIDVDSSNNVYVAGEFTNATQSDASDLIVNNIAKWNGSQWSNINTTNVIGVDSYINSLFIKNNKVYIGGRFTSSGDISANYFSVYDINKNIWDNLSSTFNNMVNSVFVDSNDIIYSGGSFGLPFGSISKYSSQTITRNIIIPNKTNKKI